MKKNRIFVLIVAAVGLLSSCLRSDDLELLRHPIHVTGSVNPEYGVPVAYGEMNINDILSRLSEQYQGIITDDEVITVQYQATGSDTIYALSNMPSFSSAPVIRQHHVGAKDEPIWYYKDTIVMDTIDVDFFNDVQLNGGIDISHIWLTLGVSAYGDLWDTLVPYIHAQFDNLSISYDDHDGVRKTFSGLSVDPVVINDITDGFERHFDSVDIARIINDMPRRVYATYRLRFQVSSDVQNSDISSLPFNQVLDSVRMTRFIYSADINLNMPLSVKFNDLSFSYNLDLGDGLAEVDLNSIGQNVSEGLSIDVDSSLLRMTLDNGIPLEMTLDAILKDANGRDLKTLFSNELVKAPVLMANPNNPLDTVAFGSSRSILETHLDADDLQLLSQAKTIKVNLKINSRNTHVSIRRDDFLKIKVFLRVHPSVAVDISLTDDGLL
ncbi:MAG: hypothetical protein IJ745_06595 [Bacteroidales bacterium]|nr:hypothetical protein [Bacteroidales bacterium]